MWYANSNDDFSVKMLRVALPKVTLLHLLLDVGGNIVGDKEIVAIEICPEFSP